MGRIRKSVLSLSIALLITISFSNACLRAKRIDLDPNFGGGASGLLYLALLNLFQIQPYLAVAVGNSGTVLTSTDGQNWSAASSPPSLYVDLNSVLYTGSRFVAVGQDASSTTEAIYTSTDGQAWSAASLTGCGGVAVLHDVAQGNGVIVAAGEYAVAAPAVCVQVSSDGGSTWTKWTGLSGYQFFKIGFDGSSFVAFTTTYSFSSKTGNAFAQTAGLPLTSNAMTGSGAATGITTIGSSIIVTGTDNYIQISPPAYSSVTANSGVSYTDGPSLFQASTTNFANALAFNGSLLVAAGDGCQMDRTTSPSTLSWTNQTLLMASGCSVQWRGMAWDGSRFIAVGAAGYIATSTSGLENSWSPAIWTESQLNGIAIR